MKPTIIQFRDYQDRDVKDIVLCFKEHDGVFYQLPTGGGKSVVTSEVVDIFAKKTKVLVLAHRKELLEQMQGHFENRELEAGFMMGKKETNLDAPVVIASVHTATKDKRLDTLLEYDFGLIVVDEAHRIASSSYENILNKIREKNPKAKLLGISATPYRKDKKDLRKYFTHMICSESVQSLIQKGYLSKYRTYSTPVKDLDEEVEKSGDDYQTASLSAYMKTEERINYAIDSYKELGENRQMLVFCVDRSHARAVEAAYIKAGFKSIAYLDGDTPEKEREEILENYRKKSLKIIVCIETLTEGTDLPETGCIQLLRPTLSLTLYMQMVGRGLRPKEDGSDLIILDCAGCSQEFGLVSSPKSWSLDPSVDPSKPREGNKVVARRRNGSYVEDLDDAEFLELEEMTYQEYLEKVISNEENAKKHNEDIEKKIKQKQIELCEYVIQKSGAKGYKPKEKEFYSHSSNLVIFKKVEGKTYWGDPSIKIYLPDTGNIHADRESGMDSETNKAPFIENLMVLGKISDLILNDKKFKTELIRRKEEINKLYKDRVDIHSIQAKARELNEEIFNQNAMEFIKTNNVIKLGKVADTNSTFNVGWYDRQRFVSIRFKKNVIGYKNEIECLNESGEVVYKSSSTKKEKILSILKNYEAVLS